MSSRERKLLFLGDRHALSRAVGEMLATQGADWLTEEQIGDLVRNELVNIRFRRRNDRHNRAINEARLRKENVA